VAIVTKHRRGVLTAERYLREVPARVCTAFKAVLVEYTGEGDHIHLLVSYPPQVAVSRLINSLNGALQPRHRYQVHTHPNHLWSPSYLAASREGEPSPTIQHYINN
jgi:putative transposase